MQDLEIRFGGNTVFSNLNIKINENEIYGLIGTNGAGKTTTFNIICGFLEPTAGKIIYDGQDITGMEPWKISKLGIGRCFQNVLPFRSMTPLENIKVARANGRKVDRNMEITIEEILHLTNLTDKKDLPTDTLTLPDKKNIEVARALATNPKVILFDEMASGLSGEEINARMDLMRDLAKNRGITIVVVEHIMMFIKQICDRVGVLHAGNLIAEGLPVEVGDNEQVIEAYLGRKSL